jgi:arylsulfatase A-like enzyme
MIRQLLLSLLCVISVHAELAGKRPNIIFLLTDDQGYGDLSSHGNPILKTPNSTASPPRASALRTSASAPPAPPPAPPCSPAVTNSSNGITHTILERERLTPQATTLAQVLKSAGYTTGIFGKWHLGDEPEYWPSARGFDEMFIHGAGGIGQSYPGSCGDAPGNKYFDPAILHNGTFEPTKGYCTDVFFAQAEESGSRASKANSPSTATSPPTPRTAPTSPARRTRRSLKARSRARTCRISSACCTTSTRTSACLLDKLKEWGIENDTLVIFMNDNGGTAGTKVFNAGLRAAKGSPWMGGIKASSLWRWPGTLTPPPVTKLTAHIDFFPTLAELAGAKLTDEVKAQIEGRSLVSLLENPNAEWADRQLFTHVGRWPKDADPQKYKFTNCSVRTTRWHLVNANAARGGQAKNNAKGKKANAAPKTPAGTAAKDANAIVRAGPEPMPAAWQLFDLQSDEPQRGSVMQPKGAEPWRALPWDSRAHHPHHVPGPQRGPVMGDAVPQGRSGDGTSLRFMIRRGSWVVRFPGERSLSLGTPGLHDESPLGLAERHTRIP